MRSYLIWAPAYDNASGGIVVLHRLAVELRKRGEKVFINTGVQNQKWPLIPLMPNNMQTYDKAIAVYPEILNGNPFYASTVVRWLLNIPGVCGGPASINDYEKTDFFYIYDCLFNSKIGLPEENILHCPHIDLDVFYDKHLPRVGRAVYRGKGTQPDHPLANYPLIGGKESFRGDEGQARLCELLNRCSLLYVYDPATAITDIARLCGCPVVVIPDGSYSKEDYGWTTGGIGYGVEEAAIARATINSEKMRADYEEVERKFQLQLTRFIELTQKG
jgi:hypothetical protein